LREKEGYSNGGKYSNRVINVSEEELKNNSYFYINSKKITFADIVEN